MTAATDNTPHQQHHAGMRVLSLCTGIAGDVAAFRHAGVPHEVAAVAEFDPVASAVLAEKFPGVPNLRDITAVNNWKDYHGRSTSSSQGFPASLTPLPEGSAVPPTGGTFPASSATSSRRSSRGSSSSRTSRRSKRCSRAARSGVRKRSS